MSKRQHNVTAIIYDKRGRVLSVGKNSYIKTHPMQLKHALAVGKPEKQYLHAEIHAISRCKDLSKAHRIVVSRWDRAGKPVLAKPCIVCMDAIRASGIENIEHT